MPVAEVILALESEFYLVMVNTVIIIIHIIMLKLA